MNEQFIIIKDTIINKDQISYLAKFNSMLIKIYLKQRINSTEEFIVIFKSEKERDKEFYRICKQLCPNVT